MATARVFFVGAVTLAAFIAYLGKSIHELADALDVDDDE
jgi:hypothetical protein